MRRASDRHAEHFRVRARDLAALVVLGLAQAALLIWFALLITAIVGAMVPAAVGAAEEQRGRQALIDGGLVLLIACGLGWLRHLQFSYSEAVGYEVVRRLRMTMYAHLQGMLPHQLRHRARGGLLLRLTGDLSMLRMWLSRGLLSGTSSAIVLASGVGVIGWFDPWLGVAMVAGLAVTVAASIVNGRAMRAATRLMRRRRSLVISNIDEQLTTMAVQQVGGRTRGEYARLSAQNDALTRSLVRVARLRGRLRGLALAGSLADTALLLLVGLVQVRAGVVDVGQVVSALLVARLVAGHVRTLGLAHDYWHRALVSRQKIVEFLDSSSRGWELPELEPIRVTRGEVCLREVDAGVLRGISASVPARTLVGVTGPMGSGKSTLLRLLARLQDPDAGTITVDGQDLGVTNPASLARRIGYQSPDLPLLRGSLRRNLSYNARSASDAEVQRVAFGLHADEVAARLPGGVRGWLTEGGANLSLGERQLVAVARAMIGNPPLLLLDEPFTHLDGDGRARLLESIVRYQGTVVMVSHDADALAAMDEVWTLDGGRLVDVCSGHAYGAASRGRTAVGA